MLKAKTKDQGMVQLIEDAATGLVATMDNQGPEAIQDWEVDELLDWTTGLNFDDYWSGWRELATSGWSEKPVGECNAGQSDLWVSVMLDKVTCG